MLAILIVLGVVGLTVLLFTPRTCVVHGDHLEVKTWLLTFRFNLQGATEVVPIVKSEISGFSLVRIFGIGWPLRPIGWFRSPELGVFLSLANDPSNMCMVSFPKRKLLISPSGGIEEIMACLKPTP
jgi:hypothetical protein